MPTHDDLLGAFALLERCADDLADPAGPAPVLSLDLARPARTHRRRSTRVLAGVAVAAAVAVIAVGVRSGSDGPASFGPGSGGEGTVDGPAPRSLEVSVDAALGMTVVAVSIQATQAEAVLVDRTREVHLDLHDGDLASVVTPGLARVDVNGTTGYYSDGTMSPIRQAPDNPATAPPAPTPTPPETRYARSIVWPLSTHRWAEVLFEGSFGDEPSLLRVARAVIDTRPLAIRSAVMLRTAPAGLHLSSIDTTYHYPGDNAPFDATSPNWDTMLRYSPATPGTAIQIEATSVDLTVDWHGGEALTVNGHPAYWSATEHTLALDTGNGAYIKIAEVGDYGVPLTSTRDDLVAVGRQLSVTPTPGHPASWFDAADLP